MARWFEFAEKSENLYFTPELETTAIKNPLYQGTTFEYEDLDNSL
jgi:hypothetical protein